MGKVDLINGAFSIRLAIWLANTLPPSTAIKVAKIIASTMSRQKQNPLVIGTRLNQSVISEFRLSPTELDERVLQVFTETSLCLYDLFSCIKNPEKMIEKVEFSAEADQAFNRLKLNEPTIFVTPHLSNFDLIGQVLALRGYNFHVLSYPLPGKGYQYQNILRQKVGIKVTPTSLSALREARDTLRSGGSVLTGLDRPLENTKYHPLFFNHPSNLPVSYIKLALEERVPICVVAGQTIRNGQYRLLSGEPISMIPNEVLAVELIDNAERVLKVAEKFIRQSPTQWSMFYPVWPQFLSTISQIAK